MLAEIYIYASYLLTLAYGMLFKTAYIHPDNLITLRTFENINSQLVCASMSSVKDLEIMTFFKENSTCRISRFTSNFSETFEPGFIEIRIDGKLLILIKMI